MRNLPPRGGTASSDQTSEQTPAGAHPGRMVDPSSRTAATLRYAGLSPTDIPGDGVWVTDAEAAAELDRRGIEVSFPDPPPEMTEHRALGFVRPALRMGAHFIRLHPGTKVPVDTAWQNSPALTEDEAVGWLRNSGAANPRGNLGINLARSGDNGWAVIDAEDGAATAVVRAAGFLPTAVTANAQDPTTDKLGGTHLWLPLPADVDPATLRSRLQLPLDNGGTLDALVGNRYVVAPGSELDCAPGYRYGFAAGGAVADNTQWRYPPRWLIDPTVPLPDHLAGDPGAVELHALFAAAPRRPRRTPDASSDRITAEVDSVSWEQWLAGHPAIEIIGVDGSCGCPVFHYRGATTLRSGILHEGCEYGFGAHFFSGTLAALIGREHASRLDFAAWLHGVSVAEAARRVGVGLRDQFGVIDLSSYVLASATPANNPAAPEPGSPAATDSATGTDAATGDSGADQAHTPALADWGADTAPAAPATPAADPTGDGSNTDNHTGDNTAGTATDSAAGTDPAPSRTVADSSEEFLTPEERRQLANLRSEIRIREKKLATMTPGLQRANHWAQCTGVYLHGLVSALIVRTIANVPPNVVLPSREGMTSVKAVGTAVSANAMVIGPSAAGKTNTLKLASAAIPVKGYGVTTISDGTAEGICKKAREMDKGRLRIKATGLLIETDEFDSVASEMARPGSKLDSFTRKVWSGSAAGSTASDQNKDAQLPEHSTRVCLLYGAQPAALAPLIAQSNRGTPQRFDFGMAGVLRQEERDPKLYRTPPKHPILENQQNLPWWTPTGLPPGYTPPDPDSEEAEQNLGLPGYDDAPPIWVTIPKEVQAFIDEESEHAGVRSADWNLARNEDEEGISGHTTLLRLRFAFALAVWDGHCCIEMVHWEAAGLLIEMRQLVYDAVMIESRIAWVKDRRAEGEGRGMIQAEAKIVEAEVTTSAQQSACDRIMALVDAAAGVPEQVELAAKVTATKPDLFRGGGAVVTILQAFLSKRQRVHLPLALRALREHGLITGEAVIRRPGPTPALRLVKPVIGSVFGGDDATE